MGLPKLETKNSLTVEEYLAFERDADIRHEFLNGEIFAMAGESLSHSRVCSNLLRESGNKLKAEQPDGTWNYRSLSEMEMEDVLNINDMNCDLSRAEIYNRVEIPFNDSDFDFLSLER